MDRFQVQISKYTDDEKEDLNPAVFSTSRINGVLLQNQQQRYTETACPQTQEVGVQFYPKTFTLRNSFTPKGKPKYAKNHP
ncbi:hypothetical protein [Chryseobacterium gambrini]|uniref:hypothetical protein n=1 Tax=Chryseobacterium gambrini TaxID=373672 RepID=UPI003D0FB2F2